MTVESRAPPANSHAVSLSGKSVKTGTGIVVTFCPNNTLRHSRAPGEVADDWISPAFPAPASTPVTGIIGLAEERFGLRKSPTAPMQRAGPIGGWFCRLAARCCRRTCLGQKRRASQAARSVSEPSNCLRTKYSPTHPQQERLTTQIPREGDAAL